MLYKNVVQKNFKKNVGSEKNFGSENKYRSEKILGPQKFWFENVFGTNEISGLKISGPKKFGAGKFCWVLKKFSKDKNWGQN